MKRFYFAPIILALTFGSVFLLPKRGAFAQSSILDFPPLEMGEWSGTKTTPSKEEVAILDKDTIFNKAEYSSYDLPELPIATGQIFTPTISLSIVKSGTNVNNSIHRPERCLRGQGHLEMRSQATSINTPKGRIVNVQQINSIIPIPPKQKGEDPFPIGYISYYYFVGHHQLTNDHWTRTFIDMKDRLLLGRDQQWSFVMVSFPYSLGKSAEQAEMNRKNADKKIRQLLAELTDRLVKWNEVR
jgi:hypothetical protein